MAPTKGYALKSSRTSVPQAGEMVTKQVEDLAGSIGQKMDAASHTIPDTLRRTQKRAAR